MKLLWKRTDGTFVAEINNYPYHVIEGDEQYWNEAIEEAERLGDELEFEPEPIASELPEFTKLYKTTIWSRCTDAEYVAIKDVINSVPPRIQAIFADANYIDKNDPLYAMVLDGAIAVVGNERALELLEPEF